MRMPLASGDEYGSIVKSHGPLLQPNPVFQHTTGESRKQLGGRWEGMWILAAAALGSKSPTPFTGSAHGEPSQKTRDGMAATKAVYVEAFRFLNGRAFLNAQFKLKKGHEFTWN
jgi:hypothetical protein